MVKTSIHIAERQERLMTESVHPQNAIEQAILQLWGVINNLSKIEPPEPDHYRVTIFGSARVQPGDPVYNNVKTMAQRLSSMGCDIVTGGGPGLMQAANEGENAGDPSNKTSSYGIRIELPFEQGANPYVEENFTHATFFSRLHHFVRLSNAYVIVPGGIGTTLETMLIWQLLQVNHLENTPLVFMGQMWADLLTWAKRSMLGHSPQLASPEDLELPQCVESPEAVIDALSPHIHAFQTA
jgi:uncharacterized protein (TIGR00730 family)